MTGIRLLRYFSTVLSSFRYSFGTRLAGSDSRSCKRSNSPITVTEKSLMPLMPALLIRSNTMPCLWSLRAKGEAISNESGNFK